MTEAKELDLRQCIQPDLRGRTHREIHKPSLLPHPSQWHCKRRTQDDYLAAYMQGRDVCLEQLMQGALLNTARVRCRGQ